MLNTKSMMIALVTTGILSLSTWAQADVVGDKEAVDQRKGERVEKIHSKTDNITVRERAKARAEGLKTKMSDSKLGTAKADKEQKMSDEAQKVETRP